MPFNIKGTKILQGNNSRVSCLVKWASSANLAMVVSTVTWAIFKRLGNTELKQGHCQWLQMGTCAEIRDL